ncbi:MAG: pantoate--beta-alanine ligase [Dehalococcoidia bacterium]
MDIATTIEEMRRLRRGMAGSVGLVPTMGALHEGHLSLVRRARADDDHVVVSVFVNPTQFGPQEDLRRYPRSPKRDLTVLEAEGMDVVFMPSAEEVYRQGFDTWVTVGGVTERLEGAARPGHFGGVATVVAKLFNIVQPQRAYFGRKDAQQLVVIQKMVADLDLEVEVVSMPTVREADGLALSSRNAYLSPQERRAATVLWRALCLAERLYQDGQRDAAALRRAMEELIAHEPLAGVDYVSVADAETLAELDCIEAGRPALASLAAYIGRTRLIDNMTLEI